MKSALGAGEAEVVGNHEVGARVLRLISEAQTHLTLVSPYVDFDGYRHIPKAIARAIDKGVEVKLVVRAKDSSVKRDVTQSPAINELVAKGMRLLQSKDLHAKVYASEKASLVTSLNLLESSFNNSVEVGVWFAAGSSGHSQVLGFLRTELKDQISNLESERPARKRERSKKRAAEDSEASCIRCRAAIEFNEDRPLCRECYGKWKVYENSDYDENYCHACGDEAETTVAKPLCNLCFYSQRAR